MDLHSRRIISHKVGKFMDIKLVMDTLKIAIYKKEYVYNEKFENLRTGMYEYI